MIRIVSSLLFLSTDKILRLQFFLFVLCIGLLPAIDWNDGILMLYVGRETARGQARNKLYGQERRTQRNSHT